MDWRLPRRIPSCFSSTKTTVDIFSQCYMAACPPATAGGSGGGAAAAAAV